MMTPHEHYQEGHKDGLIKGYYRGWALGIITGLTAFAAYHLGAWMFP